MGLPEMAVSFLCVLWPQNPKKSPPAERDSQIST